MGSISIIIGISILIGIGIKTIVDGEHLQTVLKNFISLVLFLLTNL